MTDQLHAEKLVEVWRITERRGDAIYKAELVERRWIRIGADRYTRPDDDPDLMWASVSSSYEGPTVRTVRDA